MTHGSQKIANLLAQAPLLSVFIEKIRELKINLVDTSEWRLKIKDSEKNTSFLQEVISKESR